MMQFWNPQPAQIDFSQKGAARLRAAPFLEEHICTREDFKMASSSSSIIIYHSASHYITLHHTGIYVSRDTKYGNVANLSAPKITFPDISWGHPGSNTMNIHFLFLKIRPGNQNDQQEILRTFLKVLRIY